jgi:integrase
MKGHIRERSGAFEIRYSWTDPVTGKRRTATATVHGSRKDAQVELRKRLTALDEGRHVDPSRLTVGEWLRMWLAAIEAEVSPKTHERYGELVRHFLIPELGALTLQRLTSVNIQSAYTKWATEGRRDGKPGGLSAQTRIHIHRVLYAALARATEHDPPLLARNPANAFKKRLPKVERKDLVTLTPEQSTQLLAALRHSRVYWPVLLALATGMRRGEICALRWRSVDLDRGIVRVVESLEQTKTSVRFKSPKSEKHRAVTLPAFAIEELRRLKREQAEELLAVGVRQTGETLVCGRADGEPHLPLSLTTEFARRVQGMRPPVRFHDLRHSHATQLLASGVHPKIAQERLGHSTITTTLDLYSHVTDTMQAAAAEKLDAAWRVAMGSGSKSGSTEPISLKPEPKK